MNTRVIDADATPIPNRDQTNDLAGLVADGFELIRQRFAAQNETIRALTERVQDLEGHVEHGPDGTCGVCDPEPDDAKTVGADEYGSDVVIADFVDDCAAAPDCTVLIKPGHEIVNTHEGWRHRDCTR